MAGRRAFQRHSWRIRIRIACWTVLVVGMELVWQNFVAAIVVAGSSVEVAVVAITSCCSLAAAAEVAAAAVVVDFARAAAIGLLVGRSRSHLCFDFAMRG